MSRKTEEQEALVLQWQKDADGLAVRSQIIKYILWFFLIFQPIGAFVLASEAGHSWVIYLVVLAAYIPTVWYVLSTQNRIPRNIEARKYQNISRNMPPALGQLMEELIASYNIPSALIEYWVNNKDMGISPTVASYKGKYHIILPLGFLRMFTADPQGFRNIMAHELSHIRQKDTDILVTVKVFLRSVLYFVLPVLIINIAWAFTEQKNRNHEAEMMRIGAAMEAFSPWEERSEADGKARYENLQYVENFEERTHTENAALIRGVFINFLLACGAFWLLRKLIYMSERIADMGAVLHSNTESLQHTLSQNDEGRTSLLKRAFSVNPDVAWRLKRLQQLGTSTPGATETYKEEQTVTPDTFRTGPHGFLSAFVFVVVVLMPIALLSTLYRLSTLPAGGQMEQGALVMAELLAKIILTIYGISTGLDVLKKGASSLKPVRLYCIIYLVFTLVDVVVSMFIFHNAGIDTTPLILKSALPQGIFFLIALGVFSRKNQEHIASEGHDFSTYVYTQKPVYNIALGFGKVAFYTLIAGLIIVPLIVFVKSNPYLFYRLFATSREFSITDYIEDLLEDSIFHVATFLLSLVWIAYALLCAVNLAQRRLKSTMLLRHFTLISLLLALSQLLYLALEPATRARNWYFFNYKLEDGYRTGQLVVLFAALVVLLFFFLFLKRKSNLKPDQVYYTRMGYGSIGLMLIALACLPASYSRNPDRVSTIRTGKSISDQTSLLGLSADKKTMFISKVSSMTTDEVQAWDIEKGTLLASKEYHRDSFGTFIASYDPVSDLLIMGVKDELVVMDSKLQKQLRRYGTYISYGSPVYNHDASLIAFDTSVAINDSIELSGFAIRNTEGVVLLAVDTGNMPDVSSMSPDGRYSVLKFYTGGSGGDYQFYVYDVNQQKVLYQLPAKKENLISFSPDSRQLRYASFYKDSLVIADVASNMELTQLYVEELRYASDNKIAYSQDGKYLAAFDRYEPHIAIYEIQSGRLLKKIRDNREIREAFFSKDNKLLLTGGTDNEVKVFRTGL